MSLFSTMPEEAARLSFLGDAGRAAIVDLLVLMLFSEGGSEEHVDAFVTLLAEVPGLDALTNEARGELLTRSLTRLRELPPTGLEAEVARLASPLPAPVRPTVVALAGVVACFGGSPTATHKGLLELYATALEVDAGEVERTMDALSLS